MFFTIAPQAIAEFQIKLQKERVGLMPILFHEAGLVILKDFCESEYSAYNIDFWIQVILKILARSAFFSVTLVMLITPNNSPMVFKVKAFKEINNSTVSLADRIEW